MIFRAQASKTGGRGRRAASLVVVPLFTAALLVPSSATAGLNDLVGRLGANDSVFWSEPKAISGNRTLLYRIEVLEPGMRLRVALDHSGFDRWRLRVAGGSEDRTATAGPYSSELFIDNAKPGMYTVSASASDLDKSVIRFRAKLEDKPVTRGSAPLLPNLRIAPPYDVTLTGAPWYLFMARSVAPSCFPEETAQERVTRCLRFSFGPENAGDGPLELVYAAPANHGGEHVMYQRITYANGKTTQRRAGTYEYHAAHAHYHHPLIAGQQLFKVVNPRTGRLAEAGVARKTGFCMLDYMLVDWKRFYQAPIKSVESSCGFADAPYRDLPMGLSTGWADIYTYSLEGNYIDFDEGEDGLYVIRAFTNQDEQIKETDYSDNMSYAYIKVTGDEVKLLERGYGTDPWDRNKSVLNDPRNFSTAD
ncbi:MAG TPA: lysyl oxidase family protein [Actinomycetota bacterium]|nr:lysyl oxidase family protein [Actinomycetota bacterium]